MTPTKKVASLYLASLDPGLAEAVKSEIRRSMLKYLREMKAPYRKMYNAQKVDGKVFESILETSIPNYEALMGGGVGLDSGWVPYVGNVNFDRGDLPAVREMARQAVFDVLSELFGEALGMSSAFRWDTETAEEFWFLTRGYDVRAAKRIIVSRPRVVESLEVEPVKGIAFRTQGMNPDSASVDIKFPVLVVTTAGGNYLPIDGWNRIRKAIRQGEAVVPAVFLNASESKKITL